MVRDPRGPGNVEFVVGAGWAIFILVCAYFIIRAGFS